MQIQTLKGFRDFIGDEVTIRRNIFRVFQEIFEKYGYEPLETPTLEYFELLMNKYGEEEKLVYRFEDFGKRKVAMRYDLTVPTSRVMAQYRDKLPLPWKRYQIQPVWRADNTQKGRYREFYQLDADIFGSKAMTADAEFIDMGIEIINKLGFKDFQVRLNNRKILNAIAKFAGREDKSSEIIYAIDKWEKRSPDETRKDLAEKLADGKNQDVNGQIDQIFSCLQLTGDDQEKLQQLERKFAAIPEGLEGVQELQQIFALVTNKQYLKYDPTIARGLAYYTGPIWEWNILEGGVGSIGGCGRYDHLVASFIGEEIPATGGSFGIERIIDVMKDRNMLAPFSQKTELLLMVALNDSLMPKAYKYANELRNKGLNVMLYPDSKKIDKILSFANKKQIAYVVLLGENEDKDNVLTLKDMQAGTQKAYTLTELVQVVKKVAVK